MRFTTAGVVRTVIGRPAALLAAGGSAVGGAATGYLSLLTVLGAASRRSAVPVDADTTAPRTRFLAMIPAHDEAASIAETLAAFERVHYPRSHFDVHVVADNCTDETAEIVRSAGWHVHERTGAPGKGAALNWLFDRVRREPFDVAVIVDADTSVTPGFLRALDRAFADGAVVAQGYYSVRDPHESVGAATRFMALAARHHLRPAGRARLGGSCGLFGNGMAFRRDVLERHRWTGHLIEDMELQIELLLADDVRVRYVPDAELVAEIPDNLDSATPQNRRWERGRVVLAGAAVPRLLRALRGGSATRRVALLDATCDLLVPPISVLGGVHIASFGLGAVAAAAGNAQGRRLAVVNGALATFLAGHVAVALWSVRAPRAVYAAVTQLPRMLVWKCRLWLGVLRDGEVAWERTERNREVPDARSERPPSPAGAVRP